MLPTLCLCGKQIRTSTHAYVFPGPYSQITPLWRAVWRQAVDIINPSLSVQRLPVEIWELTVRYTITFTVQELNPPPDLAFLDAIRIWVWDQHDHDVVTGWLRSETFCPMATSINRTKVVRVTNDVLDTGLGSDQFRAQIHLRSTTISSLPVERFTPVLRLLPH